jgi:hypothetical protein
VYQTSWVAALGDTLPAIPYENDAICLAAALRAACWASGTRPADAAIVVIDEPEPAWLVAAALAGVTLVDDDDASDRPVVGLLVDACASPPGRTGVLHAAARRLGAVLVLDAPAAVFDDDAVAEFISGGATLVAITEGAGWPVWVPRLAGSPPLLRAAARGSAAAAPVGAVA